MVRPWMDNELQPRWDSCHLFLHSGFGRKAVVDFLLRNGASVHARDDGGLVSLHNACSFGHADVILRPHHQLPDVAEPHSSPEEITVF